MPDSAVPGTVAAIIPAFDAEDVIRRSLDSALRQTRIPDEIIVVDDGSTDTTAEIVGTYPPPVRLVQQENEGVSAARNRGIHDATADVIAFLDADDEWRPRHLECALGVLEAHPDLQWCSSAYEKTDLRGGVRRSRMDPRHCPDGVVVRDYFEASVSWASYTPTMVLRRSLLEETGVFEPTLPRGEDLHLWFRIALRHPRLGYVAEITVRIHDTEDSLVSREPFTLARAADLLESMRREAEALGRADDPPVRRYVRRSVVGALRPAMVRGDLATLDWVVRTFGSDAPPIWRRVRAARRCIPLALWMLGHRLWAASHFLRRGAGGRRGGW